MPLHVHAHFAEAREHNGTPIGGRQATTPMAPVETLAYEFRPLGSGGAAPMHDGHVFVAAHGDPRVKIGKDGWRFGEWVRQPKFSLREF